MEKLKGLAVDGSVFKVVALEWHAKQVGTWSASHAERTKRQLERDLFPWIGERQMESIEPMELLSVLKKVEERGAIETADRGLMLVRQIWRYWLPTAGNDQRDITEGLKSRLLPYRGKNFPAIVEPQRFGELLRAMYAYKAWPDCPYSAVASANALSAPRKLAHDGVDGARLGCCHMDDSEREDEANGGGKGQR